MGGWAVEVAVLRVDVGVEEELVVEVGTVKDSEDSRDDELVVGTGEISDVVAGTVVEVSSA